MNLNYRFRIQRLGTELGRRFQLKVGLVDDEDVEFVPAYQTAFAQHFALEPNHPAEVDAHLELSALLEWLKAGGRRIS